VVKHGTSLNELSKQHQLTTSQSEVNGNKGLKSLTREGRKLLDGYQHMFYALQTSPSYLAKLIFCLPLSRSTRFLETVILTLFNFGSTPREEYLLLKLFKTALEEEIRQVEKIVFIIILQVITLQSHSQSLPSYHSVSFLHLSLVFSCFYI
jgi:hypothetical protein